VHAWKHIRIKKQLLILLDVLHCLKQISTLKCSCIILIHLVRVGRYRVPIRELKVWIWIRQNDEARIRSTGFLCLFLLRVLSIPHQYFHYFVMFSSRNVFTNFYLNIKIRWLLIYVWSRLWVPFLYSTTESLGLALSLYNWSYVQLRRVKFLRFLRGVWRPEPRSDPQLLVTTCL
jgi:hypothetical protein